MRVSRLLACCVASLFFVAACGADDDRAETVQGSDTPTADQTGDTAETPSEGPDEEEADEPETSDVDHALLTLGDMPSGWTQTPDDETDDEEAGTICDREPLDDRESIEDASASFRASETGPFVEHSVALYDGGQAEEAIDAFLAAVDSCDEWTEEDEEHGTITYRPQPLSFSSFGDQTMAVRINAESDMVNITMDAVVWRHGDALSLLTAIGAFETPDAELTEELAAIADERLAELD